MSIIWTSRAIREIESDPFKWFYGLVRRKSGELHLAEIFPGEGWVPVSFGELTETEREYALYDCRL